MPNFGKATEITTGRAKRGNAPCPSSVYDGDANQYVSVTKYDNTAKF
jgi:hypothetical protein